MTRTGESVPVENGSKRKGILLILVVFILGLICGSALTVIGARSVTRRPLPVPDGPRPGNRGIERLVEELDLDDDQRRKVREVMTRSQEQIRRVFDESRAEIRELLTEEQRDRFDEMRRERGPRKHRRGPDRGFGRGPRPEGPPPPPPAEEESPPESPPS
jgi:hypothetical protein